MLVRVLVVRASLLGGLDARKGCTISPRVRVMGRPFLIEQDLSVRDSHVRRDPHGTDRIPKDVGASDRSLANKAIDLADGR
jgi:hypothetical protein